MLESTVLSPLAYPGLVVQWVCKSQVQFASIIRMCIGRGIFSPV